MRARVEGDAARRAQEFAPGGHFPKHILDPRAGACGHGGGPVFHHAPVIDHLAPSAIRIVRPAFEREARHARDAGQCLAAEAERRDMFERMPFPHQILGQFGGRMAFERERQRSLVHPAAIVDHLDRTDPALLQRNRDTGRARIDRIFEQFLERGGRADHARGDVDAADRQLADVDRHREARKRELLGA